MIPATMKAQLQAMTDELAALWVEADTQLLLLPVFSQRRHELMERRHAIADCHGTLLRLQVEVSPSFAEAEAKRWEALTLSRAERPAQNKGPR